MNDESPPVATPSQTVGPFFHRALGPEPTGGMVNPSAGEQKIRLLVRVTDGDRHPVDDALVELWHTDPRGDASANEAGTSQIARFGRMPTDQDGTCEFETVRPGSTQRPAGRIHAAHINLCVFARGLLRQVHTRIYFADDPALSNDPVLALVPEDRRNTLMACADTASPGRWVFDIRLQGPQETVFFDV